MAKAKLPRYVAWREGRPRWIPSPKLRKGGWKGRDLKDAAGQWLTFESMRDLADRINADVDRWLCNAPTKEFAPDQDAPDPIALAGPLSEETLDAAWHRFTHSRHYLKLAPSTKSDYRSKIRPFLAFAGSDRPDQWTPRLMEEWMEKRADQLFAIKALGWPQTRWNESTAAAKAMAREARHEDMAGREEGNTPGQPQALGELAVIRRLFNYCIKPLEWTHANPAAAYGAEGLRPRIHAIPMEHQVRLVATAEDLGLAVMADAITIAIETGARAADLFAFTWDNFEDDRARFTPAKTRRSSGARVDAPLSKRLAARLDLIAERQGGRTPGGRIFQDVNGVPMQRARAGRLMAEITEKARLPGILLKDCRDTAVVRLAEAGCTPFEIASISGHSLKTVTTILRHYFAPTAAIADNAIAKLDGRKA